MLESFSRIEKEIVQDLQKVARKKWGDEKTECLWQHYCSGDLPKSLIQYLTVSYLARKSHMTSNHGAKLILFNSNVKNIKTIFDPENADHITLL